MPHKNNNQRQGNNGRTHDKPDAVDLDAPSVRITASWLHDRATQAVFEALNTKTVQTRAVGGAVRNALLNEPETDIDFATTARPEDLTALARKAGMSVHPTGIEHGTVTVVWQGKPFEVTTLRNDVSTDGRRATVAFTKNWTQDAERRDFTINALYCDSDGTLFDPLGGYQDLKNRKVRFIGDPVQRIREDYLRILRFFRFYATFATPPIDDIGLKACTNEKAGIKSLSSERIRSEILRLLTARNATSTLALMHDAGILELALNTPPDIRTLERLSAIEDHLKIPPDAVLRLGALVLSAPSNATAIAQDLKLSKAQARRLQAMSQYPDTGDPGEKALIESTAPTQRKALYQIGPQAYADICLLQWATSENPPTSPDNKAALELPAHWQAPKLPFSGADLIARGQKPGPHIGRALSQFETWWIDADFPSSPNLLEQKLMQFANQQ